MTNPNMPSSGRVDADERVRFYATAKRITAGRITQIEDGRFVSSWVGKLRGMIVSAPGGNYKHATKEAAIECAKDFRARCLAALTEPQS